MAAIKNKDGHTDIVWARVDSVVALLLGNERYMQSKRTKEIIETVKQKFAVSQRQAERYIAIAKREIRRIGKERGEKAFLKAVRDREYLLTKVKTGTDKDYKLALEIMKDRDKLLDVYPEEKVKHTGTIEEKIIFIDDLSADE